MKAVSDSTVLIGLAKNRKDRPAQGFISEDLYSRSCIQRSDGTRRSESRSKNCQRSRVDYKKTDRRLHSGGLLMTVLERGEAEVLVLANEIQADLILLDEEKARKTAVRAGFKVMGLIGILIVAKRLGLIATVGTYIEKLQREKFRLSEKIVNAALKQAGESA